MNGTPHLIQFSAAAAAVLPTGGDAPPAAPPAPADLPRDVVDLPEAGAELARRSRRRAPPRRRGGSGRERGRPLLPVPDSLLFLHLPRRRRRGRPRPPTGPPEAQPQRHLSLPPRSARPSGTFGPRLLLRLDSGPGTGSRLRSDSLRALGPSSWRWRCGGGRFHAYVPAPGADMHAA